MTTFPGRRPENGTWSNRKLTLFRTVGGNLLSCSLLRKGATYTFEINNQLPFGKGLLLIEYLLEAKQCLRCFVYSWSPAVIELSRRGVTNWSPQCSCWMQPIMKWKGRLSTRLPYSAAAKSLQSCPTLCNPIDGSPPASSIPGILQAKTLEWVAISFSNAWKWKVKMKSLSRGRRFMTPWTAAYQAPLSMGFSRQE